SLAGQDLAETAGAVLGEEGLAGAWGRDALYSRSLTIAGGTTEVNKNLLAERILGLPRDVAPPS
ncbi:MAG: acyl-CoA dehydrogenase, partial [Actinobacteria bacterium]|nr:acyl-CoA dehydrogenase [Actinomycetota bacterium]